MQPPMSNAVLGHTYPTQRDRNLVALHLQSRCSWVTKSQPCMMTRTHAQGCSEGCTPRHASPAPLQVHHSDPPPHPLCLCDYLQRHTGVHATQARSSINPSRTCLAFGDPIFQLRPFGLRTASLRAPNHRVRWYAVMAHYSVKGRDTRGT